MHRLSIFSRWLSQLGRLLSEGVSRYDKEQYSARRLIENAFYRLKDFRCVRAATATRRQLAPGRPPRHCYGVPGSGTGLGIGSFLDVEQAAFIAFADASIDRSAAIDDIENEHMRWAVICSLDRTSTS